MRNGQLELTDIKSFVRQKKMYWSTRVCYNTTVTRKKVILNVQEEHVSLVTYHERKLLYKLFNISVAKSKILFPNRQPTPRKWFDWTRLLPRTYCISFGLPDDSRKLTRWINRLNVWVCTNFVQVRCVSRNLFRDITKINFLK